MLNPGRGHVVECDRRQVRPQDAQLFEFLVGTSLHQQRNKASYPAALEVRIRMPHNGGDVVPRKSWILVGEATLHVGDPRPLFPRHPDIVAAN
jgi:hypothetical protein